MYILKLKHHFDAAHKLLDYDGACASLHGHRWEIEVEMKAFELKNDMVVDFKELKKAIDYFDHSYLNDKVKYNPTAENIAKDLWEKLVGYTNYPKDLKVTVYESPEASITYLED